MFSGGRGLTGGSPKKHKPNPNRFKIRRKPERTSLSCPLYGDVCAQFFLVVIQFLFHRGLVAIWLCCVTITLPRCWEDPCDVIAECAVKDCPVDAVVNSILYRCEGCLGSALKKLGVDQSGKHAKAERECGHTVCEQFKADACPYCKAERAEKERQQKKQQASARLAQQYKTDVQSLRSVAAKLSSVKAKETVDKLIANFERHIEEDAAKYPRGDENVDGENQPPAKKIRMG